jgi:hypothetical protein
MVVSVNQKSLIEVQPTNRQLGHSRVLTFAPLSLAVYKAFGFDNGGVLPQ